MDKILSYRSVVTAGFIKIFYDLFVGYPLLARLGIVVLTVQIIVIDLEKRISRSPHILMEEIGYIRLIDKLHKTGNSARIRNRILCVSFELFFIHLICSFFIIHYYNNATACCVISVKMVLWTADESAVRNRNKSILKQKEVMN